MRNTFKVSKQNRRKPPSAGAARELFRGRAGAQKSIRLSRY
jgi:hypothetical protein